MSGSLAVFAVDPGGTTGVARGEFDMMLDSHAAVLRQAVVEGFIESWEIEGPEDEQAEEIAGEYLDWYEEMRKDGYTAERIVLAFEDFILDPRRATGNRKQLSPVRLTEGVRARLGRRATEIQLQTPSAVKSFATNDRLRRWGLWVVGSEHRRDANRHLAYRVAKELR